MVADFTPPLILWLPSFPQLISSLTNPGSVYLPIKHLALQPLPLGLLGKTRISAKWGSGCPNHRAPNWLGILWSTPASLGLEFCPLRDPTHMDANPLRLRLLGKWAKTTATHLFIRSLSLPLQASQFIWEDGRLCGSGQAASIQHAVNECCFLSGLIKFSYPRHPLFTDLPDEGFTVFQCQPNLSPAKPVTTAPLVSKKTPASWKVFYLMGRKDWFAWPLITNQLILRQSETKLHI